MNQPTITTTKFLCFFNSISWFKKILGNMFARNSFKMGKVESVCVIATFQ